MKREKPAELCSTIEVTQLSLLFVISNKNPQRENRKGPFLTGALPLSYYRPRPVSGIRTHDSQFDMKYPLHHFSLGFIISKKKARKEKI
jgi:hypothetical protein